MNNYYFTYGSEGQPFVGGWTKVVAEDLKEAVDMFKAIHPCKNGLINCEGVYDEKSFYMTTMPFKGNMRKFQHEIIMRFEMSLDEKWKYLENITPKEALILLTNVCGYSHDTMDKALYALTGYRSFEAYLQDNYGEICSVVLVED